MKKTNWFISILIFSPILFLLIYILITPLLDRKSVTDLYLDTITKKEFHGILDKIYKDPKNHNTLTVCSNKTCYTIPASWESYFKIGDSISKNKIHLS